MTGHRILLCGDSLTLRRGVSADLPTEQSCTYFDWALHSQPLPVETVVNMGRGGARLTRPNLNHGEASLLDCIQEQLAAARPSVTAVLIGLNDILLENLPSHALAEPLARLISQCQAQCDLVLVGTYPPVSIPERNREVNNQLQQYNTLIREFPVTTPGLAVMDMASAYDESEIDSHTSDGLHPNPAGARAMGDCARKVIADCLQQG